MSLFCWTTLRELRRSSSAATSLYEESLLRYEIKYGEKAVLQRNAHRLR